MLVPARCGPTVVRGIRQAKSSSNDADRLRKYLARFGLDWARIQERTAG
jgi:transcriptional regulatory protein RtcR